MANMIPNIFEQIKNDSLAYNVWRDKYQLNNETLEETIERCVNDIAEKTIQNFEKYFEKLNQNKELYFELSELGKSLVSGFSKTPVYEHFEGANKLTSTTLPEKFEINEKEIRKWIKNIISFDKILPQGSALFGLGNLESNSSISNCFVIESPHDSLEGIHNAIGDMKTLEKARGGVGVNVSTIRPKGAKVKNQSKVSTGVCAFVKEFSDENNIVAQDGRRGALMINLSVNHPDIIEFIKLKNDLSKITGANLSVIVTEEFMDQLKKGDKHVMRFPVDADINSFNIDYDNYETLQTFKDKKTDKTVYIKVINSYELWDAIIYSAWKVAEPGVLFENNWYEGGIDSIYPQFKPISTNPCVIGETLILTKNGHKRIDSLVGQEVEIWNGKQWSKVIPQITGENVNVSKVELTDGTILPGVTDYHKFPIWKGWSRGGHEIMTELRHLNIGDKISKFEYPVVEGELEIDEKEIYTHKYIKNRDARQFIKIKSITPAGIADKVYCFNEPYQHKGIFNGILLGNCSEICMGTNDSCRLIAYNLMDIVDNPYLEDAKINIQKCYENFYYQLIIADQLIDIEIDHLENIRQKVISDQDLPTRISTDICNLYDKIIKNTKDGRRCGCGFLGLADLLASTNYKISMITENTGVFGINTLLHQISSCKFAGELAASIDLAILTNPFKGFDAEKDLNQRFFRNLENSYYTKDFERMRKFGRRNVSFSTVAPTGTISLLTGVTPGIEPLFQPFYRRRVKIMTNKEITSDIENRIHTDVDGQRFLEYNVIHRQFLHWIFIHKEVLFPAGDNWDYESLKTMLENLEQENLQKIFELSPWYNQLAENITPDHRLKLQSIIQKYTTHAISSTLNLHKDTPQSTIDEIYRKSYELGLKGNTVYRDGSRSGILIKTNKPEKLNKRPNKLDAIFHKIIHDKKIYGVLISFHNDKPFELFILDKMVIVKDHGDKLTGHITKLEDNTYNFIENESDIESEYDNEINPYLVELWDLDSMESKKFKIISLFVSKMLRENISIRSIIKLIDKSEPFVSEFNFKLRKILTQYSETNAEQCPKCKNKLRNEGGCLICPQCGWGKC